jgi:hypothetical protein
VSKLLTKSKENCLQFFAAFQGDSFERENLLCGKKKVRMENDHKEAKETSPPSHASSHHHHHKDKKDSNYVVQVCIKILPFHQNPEILEFPFFHFFVFMSS